MRHIRLHKPLLLRLRALCAAEDSTQFGLTRAEVKDWPDIPLRRDPQATPPTGYATDKITHVHVVITPRDERAGEFWRGYRTERQQVLAQLVVARFAAIFHEVGWWTELAKLNDPHAKDFTLRAAGANIVGQIEYAGEAARELLRLNASR